MLVMADETLWKTSQSVLNANLLQIVKDLRIQVFKEAEKFFSSRDWN